jgi:GDP-mannose transporter
MVSAHVVEATLSLTLYSACSIGMTILNKLVMSTYGLDHPLGLLALQNGGALVIAVVGKRCGWLEYPAFDANVARKWLPLTVLFVAMLFTSMKSLKLMSVAVQTILKSLATVFIVIGDAYFFGKRVTPMMGFSFLLMILGSYIGTAADGWVTAAGLVWTFANIATTVAYVLYMKTLLGDVTKDIGRYGPVFYSNFMSLPFLILPALPSLPAMSASIAALSGPGILCLVLSIVVGAVMSFSAFWCMNLTSPTTYSVVGTLNRIPLAILGIFIFHQTPSLDGILGICCAMTGGIVYTYVNLPGPSRPSLTSPTQTPAMTPAPNPNPPPSIDDVPLRNNSFEGEKYQR